MKRGGGGVCGNSSNSSVCRVVFESSKRKMLNIMLKTRYSYWSMTDIRSCTK